jgi:hypothetical protein
MASTTTLGTNLSTTSIGTSRAPLAPMESATVASPLITSTSAVTDANLIGGYDVPAGTSGQCLYRQATAGNTVTLMPFIGHATTPAAKTATLYIVLVHEIRPRTPGKNVVYQRTVAGTLALTGSASGGNLVASALTALSDTLSGFATWAPCDIVATSWMPGNGIQTVGDGRTPNNQAVTFDALGAAFIEVWGVNGAGSQGVAVFAGQC